MWHMETTTTRTTTSAPARQAVVNSFAIVGFIVLIILGIMLAVYAASFVPKAVSRIGAAAVYLTSSFSEDGGESQLEVVPPPSSESVPFGNDVIVATTTATTTTTVTAQQPQAPVRAGTPVQTSYQVPVKVPVALSGLPDLTVEITAIGYLRTSDTDSFVRSNEVPDNKRGAVKFAIINRGTNTSGTFKFDAKLPTTSSSFTFTSGKQQSLKPGDRIDYVLGFDRAKSGNDREIRITVDADRDVRESNESNNTDTDTVDIEK